MIDFELIRGIPEKYVINYGIDSEGLYFIFVKAVKHIHKYNWGGNWVLTFEDYEHVIDAEKYKVDSFDYFDGELLIGFVRRL
jgi:hypothetical protein